MPVIATENQRISNVLKSEYEPELAYCRLVVTVNEATAKTYVPGMVLGKITASGKFLTAVETAVDGSKTAAAVVLFEQAIPAATDTKVVVLVKGPASVAKGGLVLDATYNDATKRNLVYTTLEGLGIQVLESA
jgi:hypothetical protein